MGNMKKTMGKKAAQNPFAKAKPVANKQSSAKVKKASMPRKKGM
jgi:hypothetical protein